MGILLGCDKGLIMPCAPQSLPCPLRRPDLIAHCRGRLAALDNTARLLWLGGEVYPADAGAEALLLLPGACLTLSGETDCLTLRDPSTGAPLLAAPVGVYPQDMCLVPGGLLAVCGGYDGTVRLLIAPENEQDCREQLFLACSKAQLPILDMRTEKASLEDIFLEFTQGDDTQETAETTAGKEG